jgi:Flp pilus assembly protein TadD
MMPRPIFATDTPAVAKRSRRGLLAALLAFAAIGGAAPAAAADLAPPKSAQPAGDPMTKARAAIERKEWTVAIRDLDDLVKREPKNADAHSLLGYSLRNNGDLKNSMVQYEEALRLEPDHKGAHEYVGELYLKMKQPENAQKHLKILERLCGKDCEQYEDLAKAIDDYQKH